MNQNMSQMYPGGLFIGFIGVVDRKAAEQIAFYVADACKQGYREANLLMDCPGGTVDCGFYAASVIAALPIKLNTYNIGDVASTGNIIFLSGAERYSIEGASFFFHQTTSNAPPEGITNSVLRNRVKAFALSDLRICQFVADRTGKTLRETQKWHREDTHMDPKQALANGVIHGIKAPSIPGDAFFLQIIF